MILNRNFVCYYHMRAILSIVSFRSSTLNGTALCKRRQEISVNRAIASSAVNWGACWQARKPLMSNMFVAQSAHSAAKRLFYRR
jgi:hypothetical protein